MLATAKRVYGPVGPEQALSGHGSPINDGCRFHEHHPAQRPPGECMETLSLLTYPIIFEHMPQPNYDDVLLADFNAYKLWVGAGCN